jgi:endonuclease YncB( thermonuclease family)
MDLFPTPDLFSLKGYIAPARICNCHDGDTVHLVFNYKGLLLRFICRLFGIDTPEMYGNTIDLAKKSRNRLIQLGTDVDITLSDERKSNDNELENSLLNNKKVISAHFCGKDKYGRELVVLYDGEKNINEVLLAEGHCKEYFGGKKV